MKSYLQNTESGLYFQIHNNETKSQKFRHFDTLKIFINLIYVFKLQLSFQRPIT